MSINSVTLQTSDSDIIPGDIIGRLNFAAPSETSAGFSILPVGSIYSQAEENFTSSANRNSLVLAVSSGGPLIPRVIINNSGYLLVNNISSLTSGNSPLNLVAPLNVYVSGLPTSTNSQRFSFSTTGNVGYLDFIGQGSAQYSSLEINTPQENTLISVNGVQFYSSNIFLDIPNIGADNTLTRILFEPANSLNYPDFYKDVPAEGLIGFIDVINDDTMPIGVGGIHFRKSNTYSIIRQLTGASTNGLMRFGASPLGTNELVVVDPSGSYYVVGDVRTTTNQSISGVKTFQNSLDLFLRTASGTSINIDSSSGNFYYIPLSGVTTVNNPFNPVDGRFLNLRIRQSPSGTINWGNKFRFRGDLSSVVLSNSGTLEDRVGFEYNALDDKWDCVSFVSSIAFSGGGVGTQGATGATGTAGTQGATGASGISGVFGATGATGNTGLTGATGATGASGISGVFGATGATGPAGSASPSGAVLVSGNQFISGVKSFYNTVDFNVTTVSGSTISIFSNSGNKYAVRVSGVTTIQNPISGVDGRTLHFRLRQSPSGTVSWGNKYRFLGLSGLVLSTTTNYEDRLAFEYNLTDDRWDCVAFSSFTESSGITGPTGATGATGTTGNQGATGASGISGVAGPTYTAGSGITISANQIAISGNGIIYSSGFASTAYTQVSGAFITQNSSFTLSGINNGKTILCSGSNQVVVSVSGTLPLGFSASFIQTGPQPILYSGVGATIRNRQGHTRSSGVWAVTSLIHFSPTIFVLAGDTSP